MNIIQKVKLKIITSAMTKKKETAPFDAAVLDLHELTPEAGELENNSYFFGAHSVQGESITMRLGQRVQGYSEVFVMYRSPEGRFYTIDQQQFPSDKCPLSVENIIPARDWMVHFDGTMIDTETNEAMRCRFDLRFTSRLPIFYPMKDADLSGMARAFAMQKWNKAFFKSMKGDTGMGGDKKSSQQYHYEQTGRLSGQMQLGEQQFSIDLAGIRDRAFGRRDWNYMDSHVWLVAVTERGEVMNISIVNYPHAKKLYCGYTDIASDRNAALSEYEMLDWDWNDGKGPEVMHFGCRFTDGKSYTVTVSRVNDLVTEFDGGNFYFHEAIGDFMIGDIRARGTIEYGFNRDKSRWGSF